MTRLQCRHCRRSTGNSADFARAAGWRTFKGASLTGKPLDDVICPWCAGTAEPELSWKVRCNTCDWESAEDEDDEALDARDAKHLADDHRCEPWLEIQAPNSDVWLPPRSVNNDGSIRQDARQKRPLASVTPP